MSNLDAKKRPLLYIVNGKYAGIQPEKLDIDCRIEAIETSRISDLPALFDTANPDCAVFGVDALSEDTKAALNAWAAISEYCEMRHIPLVVVAKETDPELRTALLADAYFHPSERMELRLQITKLLERRTRILDQILVDPLTGAFNYRYLRREVDLQLSDIKRSHDTFSLVYLNLDPSESKPETRRVMTQRLVNFVQGSIRPTDCLAHHAEGGFVLVLPKTVKDDALKLMKRLTRSFAAVPIDTPEGLQHAAFSAKVREFADPGLSDDECLALMPFTDADPKERQGFVLDASDDRKLAVRKLMVAIIDDDRLIRELLKHQLADIGEELYDVEIRTFADGELFFDDPWHQQNERFLVIIDRIMPKMDGLEVLRRIRTGYDRRRYLCVMVSSKGAETDITLAIQRGANDYVVKPFSLKELKARIKRLIGGLR